MFKKVVIPVLFLSVIGLIAYVAFTSVNESLDSSFTLYKEDGNVMYKVSEDESYVDLQSDEIDLESGSYVKTSVGYAHVVFSDGSMISIDQNTEIQVTFDNGNKGINQLAGNTWHRVQELSSGDEYTVETSTAVAAVRGTTFGVSNLTAALTDVFVVSRNVDVSQFILEDGEKILKNTQKLGDGKYLSVSDFKSGGVLKVQDIPDKIRNTDWFMRNELIDYEVKDGIPRKLVNQLKQIDGLKRLTTIEQVVDTVRKENIWESAEKQDELKEKQEVFDFLASLKETYDINNTALDICANVNNGSIESDIQMVQDYVDYIGIDNAQGIIDYLFLLQTVCRDGEIDENEMQQIRSQFYSESEQTGTTGNEAFEQEINALLDKYMTLVEGQSETCAHYQNKSVEEIIAEMEAVENQYGIENQVANDVGDALYEIQRACEDGMITMEEIEAVDQLLNIEGSTNT